MSEFFREMRKLIGSVVGKDEIFHCVTQDDNVRLGEEKDLWSFATELQILNGMKAETYIWKFLLHFGSQMERVRMGVLLGNRPGWIGDFLNEACLVLRDRFACDSKIFFDDEGVCIMFSRQVKNIWSVKEFMDGYRYPCHISGPGKEAFFFLKGELVLLQKTWFSRPGYEGSRRNLVEVIPCEDKNC